MHHVLIIYFREQSIYSKFKYSKQKQQHLKSIAINGIIKKNVIQGKLYIHIFTIYKLFVL
jgi:hypothetical protein